MAVQVDLCVLVAESDVVVVLDVNGRLVHQVVGQAFLELGCHEVVAWAGARENCEVDLEPEEVEEEGDYDQADSPRNEVLTEGEEIEGALSAVDVEEIPQVEKNGTADSEEGERADIFG